MRFRGLFTQGLIYAPQKCAPRVYPQKNDAPTKIECVPKGFSVPSKQISVPQNSGEGTHLGEQMSQLSIDVHRKTIDSDEHKQRSQQESGLGGELECLDVLDGSGRGSAQMCFHKAKKLHHRKHLETVTNPQSWTGEVHRTAIGSEQKA